GGGMGGWEWVWGVRWGRGVGGRGLLSSHSYVTTVAGTIRTGCTEEVSMGWLKERRMVFPLSVLLTLTVECGVGVVANDQAANTMSRAPIADPAHASGWGASSR